MEIENRTPEPGKIGDDADLIRFFSQCFDRPAFQDPFVQEGSIEAFDKAIEDTITAINTGCLRSRDGIILAQAKGKSYLSNSSWRERMDVIVDLLRAVRSRYTLAVEQRQIHFSFGPEHTGRQWYCIYDQKLAEWVDTTRAEIIEIFSGICKEADIPSLVFPRNFGRKPRL
ncbi:MAG: HNH endonuclease [Blastocatellia bacterium]|nr:HNH endonuclease [Blastocatellia bacterium]